MRLFTNNIPINSTIRPYIVIPNISEEKKFVATSSATKYVNFITDV